MNALEGWKTIIIAALTMLAGVAEKLGYTLPGDFVVTTSDALMMMGGVFFTLRMVTKTPPGKKSD